MYNYYPQQYPNQQQGATTPANNFPRNAYQPSLLKGHPVAGLEEVKATSIDFDGSIFYFPDLANKRIYTKAISLDGNAIVNMYELKPLPAENLNTGDFITRPEFEQTISELIAKLTAPQQVQQQAAPPAQPSVKEVF